MRALICETPGELRLVTLPEPQPKDGHAIIAIKRIGICGTDLHAYQGNQPYFTYPRILGHELAATFVSAATETGFSPGDAVTIIPYFNCGACIACRTGKPNCCVKMQVCGVHVDGGMVDLLQVPVQSLIDGRGLHVEQLALIEPLAISVHGLERAAVTEKDNVLVIGAGPIGLGALAFARIAGANTIAMDVSETRLAFCRDDLSIKHTINPAKENAFGRLSELTGNDMATVVIDATGNKGAIEGGLQYLAHGGRFVLIGLQKEAFSFNHPEFHKRETTLMSSRNATRDDFNFVIEHIRKGLIDPRQFITHRTAFEKVPEQFAGWTKPESGVIKAMIEVN